jgi:hypothetical protein
MGIRYLNRFLKENAHPSIKLCKLAELSGKKIAVDISIYIYRFASDNTLIENIYLMLSVFRYYNIIPIFVFDGKPPDEKRELIKKRKEDKKEAENEYNKLKNILDLNKDIDDFDKQEIINNMDTLKKKFVSVSKNDIENVFRYYMNMQLQHEKVNPLTVDPHSISIAVADCSMANGFVHGVQFVVSPFKNDLPFYCPAGGCDMFRLFYVVTPYQPSEMLECSGGGTWIDPGQKEQRVAAWRKNAVEKDDTEGLLSKLGEHVDPQIRILLSIYGLDEDFVFAPYRAAFAQKWLENVKAPVVL